MPTALEPIHKYLEQLQMNEVRRGLQALQQQHPEHVEALMAVLELKHRYLNLLATNLVVQNISAIFFGPSATGKTHLALALGHAACQRNQPVRFVRYAAMMDHLQLAAATNALAAAFNPFTTPALLIIDELVCLSKSPEQVNLLYQVIARRHDAHRPTAVTTTQPPANWGQVLHNKAVAVAITDRFFEPAELFCLEGTICSRPRHRA